MTDNTYALALERLRKLNPGSVVLDSDRDAWQLTPSGWTCVGFDGTNARDMDASSLALLTPIVIIHEEPSPEAGAAQPELLSMPEQIALMETIAVTPLANVASGTVHVRKYGNDQVLVEWDGVSIIPGLQLESVLRTVSAERSIPEQADPGHTCRYCGTRIRSTPIEGVFEHLASVSIVGLHPATPIAEEIAPS